MKFSVALQWSASLNWNSVSISLLETYDTTGEQCEHFEKNYLLQFSGSLTSVFRKTLLSDVTMQTSVRKVVHFSAFRLLKVYSVL